MGRRPKPTHLRVVENTLEGAAGKGRGKRRAREPQPPEPLAANRPPADFNDAEKKVWSDYLQAAPAGLLRTVDEGLLRLWCIAYVTHADAREKLREGAMLAKTSNGNEVQSPYLGIMNRQAVIMKSLAAEMGFSPAARTRISVEDGEDNGDATAAKYFR